MRHRGESQSISFRMSGTAVKKLAELSEAQRVSLGEFSRAVVLRHLQDQDEFRRVVEMIEALSQHHRRQTETLGQTIEELSSEVAALRKDFNRAVGKE